MYQHKKVHNNKIKRYVTSSLICLSLLLRCNYSWAIESQSKIWGDVFLWGPLLSQSKLRYVIQPQLRYSLKPNQFEMAYILGGLGYQATPRFGLWSGYLWESGNAIAKEKPLNRLWQQIIWQVFSEDRFILLDRSRLEERNQVGQSGWNRRYREYLELDFPKIIFNKYMLIFYDETFFNINQPAWIRNQPVFEQNRFFSGIGVPITKKVLWRLGYLNQYLFRKYSSNRMDHIFYTSIIVSN